MGPLDSRQRATIGTGEVLFQALIDMTERQIERVVVTEGSRIAGTLGMAEVLAHFASHSHLISLGLARDRKRVVEGKSGSVRVDLGGRRIIKKKQIVITGICRLTNY